MKQRVLLTAALVILATLALTTGLAPAQTTSNGPYYATPSWDQKLQCDTLATCPRFIVLSNWGGAAVLDREAGLVWEQSPSTIVRNWNSSQTHCNQLTLGSRLGWRVPVLQELASLVDPTAPSGPLTLPAGHPFSSVQSSSLYWSATTSHSDAPNRAWGVLFEIDIAPGDSDKTANHLVWCVRGGQGVDPQ